MPKVSVIIPVHNMYDYMDKCLDSVRQQTLEDIEIILVENASTDRSQEKCLEYARKDSRIKFIHLDVGDLAHARNQGLMLATAEYVAFLDSDDYVSHKMYEDHYTFAKEYDLDIVYSNHVKVYDDKPSKYSYNETGEKKVMTPKEMLMLNFTHRIPVNSCTMIIRRKFFDTMHFPEFSYYEDRRLTYKLINESKKVGYIDKAYYHYYQRSGSIVHSPSWKNHYDFAFAEKRRLEFINASPLFTEEERMRLSKIVAETFLSKLCRANKKAKTNEQKVKSRKLISAMSLIPKGCNLKLKSRFYRKLIKLMY
jgi:glycosyltransferase involved in cell wall biosynthesis